MGFGLVKAFYGNIEILRRKNYVRLRQQMFCEKCLESFEWQHKYKFTRIQTLHGKRTPKLCLYRKFGKEKKRADLREVVLLTWAR